VEELRVYAYEIEDTNLRVGYTTVVPTLGVGLVLAVAVATCGSASYDYSSITSQLGTMRTRGRSSADPLCSDLMNKVKSGKDRSTSEGRGEVEVDEVRNEREREFVSTEIGIESD